MYPSRNVHTRVRLLILCLILSMLGINANLEAQTIEFDNIPALYESVFSDLDDQYLSTGLLGDRAYPIFPLHTRLGNLAYHVKDHVLELININIPKKNCSLP